MRTRVLAVIVLAATAAQAEPATTVTPVAKATRTLAGQPIAAPGGALQVAVSTYDIPPGAALPVHRHPYPRYAYVLAGTIEVTNAETGAVASFGPGGFIAEAVGRWHFGRAVGPDAVRLLVIDEAPVGAGNIELRAPAAE